VTSAIDAINPTGRPLRVGYLSDEGDPALAKKRKDALDQIHRYTPPAIRLRAEANTAGEGAATAELDFSRASFRLPGDFEKSAECP
jgi:hypothetical protein